MSSTTLSIPQHLHQEFLKVVSDDSPLNWVLFGYDKGQSLLKLSDSGEGGLEELQEELDDNKIQYAFARVIEPVSRLSKLVFISWCGDGAPSSMKGLYSFHVQDVQRFFQGFHVHLNARQEADIEPAAIMKKVKDSSGAKYSIHQHQSNTTTITTINPTPPQQQHQQPFTQKPSTSSHLINVNSSSSAAPSSSFSSFKNNANTLAQTQKVAQSFSTTTTSQYVANHSMNQQPSSTYKSYGPSNTYSKSSEGPFKTPLSHQHEQEMNLALQREKEERERYDREERERLASLANDTGNDIRKKREEQEKLEMSREKQRIQKSIDRNGDVDFEGQPQINQKWEQQHGHHGDDVRQRRLQQEQKERDREAERLRQLNLNDSHQRSGGSDSDIRRKREEQEKLERQREEERLEKIKAQQKSSAMEAHSLQMRYESENHLNSPSGFAQPLNAEEESNGFSNVHSLKQKQEEILKEQRHQAELEQQRQEEEHRRQQEKREVEELRRRNQEEELERINQQNQKTLNLSAPAATPTHSSSSEGIVAVALYSYDAAEENEISLVEGTQVTNIIQIDEGWWQGVNSKGQSGLFPANYVEIIQQPSSSSEAVSVPAPEQTPIPSVVESLHQTAQTPMEISSAPVPSSRPKAIAAYDYDASEDNEISLKEGDLITEIEFVSEDWWQGTCRGRVGLFPSNYVELEN